MEIASLLSRINTNEKGQGGATGTKQCKVDKAMQYL